MARRVRVVTDVYDDFDGMLIPEGEDDNIVFAWRGAEYEIDVSQAHAQSLDELMAPILQAARRTGGKKLGARKPKAVSAPEQPALPSGEMSNKAKMNSEREFRREVREWARENGFPDLGDSGRLPEAVRNAWDTTYPDRPVPPERSWDSKSHHEKVDANAN